MTPRYRKSFVPNCLKHYQLYFLSWVTIETELSATDTTALVVS